MNKQEKIFYINKSIIEKEIDHKYIYTFIRLHDIKYTKNMNGTFINLSILDNKLIDLLYDYINKNINNITNKEREGILLELKNYKDKKNIITKNKKEYKRYKKKENLTELDLKIIELSKTI